MACSHPHLDQLGEGLKDEDEGDEEGEDLLSVTGDEADEEAALKGHHQHHQQDEPEANPHTAHDVLQVVTVAELQGGQRELGSDKWVQHRASGRWGQGPVTGPQWGQNRATEKKASSNTSRGPEKPTTSRG